MRQLQTSWTRSLDRIGVVASVVCFVHCLATPVLLSFLAVYAHFLPSEEHTHRVLAVAVSLIGAITLTVGYGKHKQRCILILMGLGILLIVAGACFGDRLASHWSEVAITLSGSCCLIFAHRLNHTFCGGCNTCS